MRTRTLGIAILGVALALASTLSPAQDKLKAAGEPGAKPPAKAQAKAQARPASAPKVVDLNSASKAELKQLPGIGDADADRIIGARPFRTKAELVTRNLISEQHFQKIRKQVAARNPPMPKLKGTGK